MPCSSSASTFALLWYFTLCNPAASLSAKMFKIGTFLQKSWILFQLCLCTAFGKICMILFPTTVKRYILKQGEKSSIGKNPNFIYENWGPTFFSFQYLLFVLKVKWKRLEDEAFQGGPAPNTPVVDFGEETHHILDFMQDGWAFKNNIAIKRHRNLHDRMQAAQLLLKEEPLCPVVLDTMENLSSSKYAALPERLYVLQRGKVIYKGGVGPWNYCPEEVREVLEKLL
ncbi:type I iodothyronine deiodinase isoform X4 [Hemicordylus capensis]|uniref:type I iodothyronine deiodinase isoform X4 n=1 Tax=Hemicordylus capensis TaxID=884348 RepID=UPI0023028808|nr:type I iodothyronine deiodinase isoform X4 [Hemicordylus capensis]